MAANAIIYKANLNIANMDTHYYAEDSLTLAKHPSENDLRLMIRLLAFVFNANEDLVFCKGISQDDEPDLWQKGLSGDIELWIDLGQPDEKRIKKACNNSQFCYTLHHDRQEHQHRKGSNRQAPLRTRQCPWQDHGDLSLQPLKRKRGIKKG